jgi:rhodanese-related sulfurtransferase
MKSLLEEVVRQSRDGRIVPIIVSPEDGMEFYSFVHMAVERLSESREYVLIDVREPALYRDPDTLIRLPHILLPNVDKETPLTVLNALANEMPEPQRVRVFHFRAERDVSVIARWPPTLVRSIREPLRWPALSSRKADLPGIIKTIAGSFRSMHTQRPVCLAETAIAHLTEKPGETIQQLWSVIKNASVIAAEYEMDTVGVQHLRAVDRPDISKELRNKRSMSPTPSSYG